MKKTELKKMLKPLNKECVKEMLLTKQQLTEMIKEELMLLENHNHLHPKTVSLLANETQYAGFLHEIETPHIIDGVEYGDPTVASLAKEFLEKYKERLSTKRAEKVEYMLTLIAHNRGDEIKK